MDKFEIQIQLNNKVDNKVEYLAIRFRNDISKSKVVKRIKAAKDYAERIMRMPEIKKADGITVFKSYLTEMCGYEVSCIDSPTTDLTITIELVTDNSCKTCKKLKVCDRFRKSLEEEK